MPQELKAKEAIAAVLEKKFNIRKSQKNYNNEVGVPLTIIGVEKSPGIKDVQLMGRFIKIVKDYKDNGT